jgi:hypothetical protein
MTVPLISAAIDKPEWLSSMEAVLEVLNEGVVITNERHQVLDGVAAWRSGLPSDDFSLVLVQVH